MNYFLKHNNKFHILCHTPTHGLNEVSISTIYNNIIYIYQDYLNIFR